MFRCGNQVDRLLESQAGAVSTRQLLALGYSRGQVRRMGRDWLHPAEGVHVAGAPTWESTAWAGLLLGGDGAAVGQEAAGHLWGFVDEAPREVAVWTPRQCKPVTVGQWRLRFRRGTREHRYALRRTLVEDTVLDVAHDSTETNAVAVLTRALADGFTVGDRVLATLADRTRQRHRGLVEELCSTSGRGIESVLEFLFLRNVVDRHGLPRPTKQVQRRAGRVDAGYEEYSLLVELDGAKYHRDKGHDYFRDNEHIIEHDERTLHYGWLHVHSGACVAAGQLARALRRWGWDGRQRRATCNCGTV